MKVNLRFGKTTFPCELPEGMTENILFPHNDGKRVLDSRDIRHSLENPIDSERLLNIAKPGMKVAIITSDITRPVPSSLILPEILRELESAGVEPEDIIIVFAVGSHRCHSEAEHRQLVGDAVFEKYKCIDHDSEDCVHLGYTPSGTPVDIFSPVAQADLRICVGNIEYHYFAGYSGGYKAIMPGTSTRQAIQTNHSLMTLKGACAGIIEGNPVREDIEAAATFCPAHFIVNVVLNEKKETICCVSGHYITAHRQGCRFIDSLYKMKIPCKYDIVIVSAGGFPKDINMYQAQKALDNAKHAVRKGGIIIWTAACTEGFGEKTFEEWMMAQDEDDLTSRIQREFKLGGHKAAVIAMVLQNSRIFLVSEIDPQTVKRAKLEPYPDVESALQAAISVLGDQANILVMPSGGSTLPYYEDDIKEKETGGLK